MSIKDPASADPKNHTNTIEIPDLHQSLSPSGITESITSPFQQTGENFLGLDKVNTMKMNTNETPERRKQLSKKSVSPFLIQEEEVVIIGQENE